MAAGAGDDSALELAAVLRACGDADAAGQRVARCTDELLASSLQLASEGAAANPFDGQAAALVSMLAEQNARLAALAARQAEVTVQTEETKAAHQAFQRRGIPNFILEGLVADLQARPALISSSTYKCRFLQAATGQQTSVIAP